MEIVEQKQYREELLEWCNGIYFNWQRMKPSFLKFPDLKRLEEWEASCRELQEELKVDKIINSISIINLKTYMNGGSV